MPDTIHSQESTVTWSPPSSPTTQCSTWYKVFGDVNSSNRRPLIVLHGGPGVASDYVSNFSDLTHSERYSIPVIIYDQIGCGRSTHFPERKGDDTFWTEQLFLHELKTLLTHLGLYDNEKGYDLVGHSWGGMLASRHAATQPGTGLKHLIISSSPASMELWVQAQEVWRRKLPKETQDVLDECERDGKTESKDYLDAVLIYYARHLCMIQPMPEELQNSFTWMEKDPTVYHTMNGPTEFYVVGNLRNWSMVEDAHKIKVPTLLTNGWHDEAADSCLYPFFKSIPKVKWVQFAKSSHTAHFEEREKYFDVVGNFLTSE